MLRGSELTQSCRLAAARRCACTVPSPDTRGGLVTSVAPTSTAPRPSRVRLRPARTRAYCDEQHAIQADIYRRFSLSFDHFGRSSSPQNHALTQHFYRRLDAAGLIDEGDIQQVWSPKDGRFLPDRYIVGTCPHCRYEAARGDQCDGLWGHCSIRPSCWLHGQPFPAIATLRFRTSRHLFLCQSQLVERLRDWVDHRDDGQPGSHRWPAAG